MKRLKIDVIGMLMLLVCLLSPCTVQAKECKHKFVNDVCKKCGYFTVHEFEDSITFFTKKDKVPVWSEPKKNSSLVEEIDSIGEQVQIDGLLRNKSGNIWLRAVNEGGYVFIDNLYLDFSVLAVGNYQNIYVLDKAEAQAVEFFNLVRPGGQADYKNWLDPSSKGIEYTVLFDDTFYQMTAEELGNIHYGFLGTAVGFSSDVLLYAGGMVNQVGKMRLNSVARRIEETENVCGFLVGDLKPICVITVGTIDLITQIYSECSGSYCDTKEDAEDVQRGIDYYETGEFVR